MIQNKTSEFIDFNLKYDISKSLSLDNLSVLDNPLQMFLQEIEIAINSSQFDGWGNKKTINIQQYLFNKFISTNKIKNGVKTFITENCISAGNFNFDTDCKFYKYNNKEFMIISVIIYRENFGNDVLSNTQFVIGN